MIPVEYYTSVYYFILSLCVLLMVLPLFKYTNLDGYSKSVLNFKSAILLIVVIGFIGLRDPWGNWRYFGDTGVYTRLYESLSTGGDFDATKDLGFYVYMKLCGNFMNIQLFYVTCALLYVIPPYLAFKKWFKKNAFYALALFVVSMSFWSFGINGIRNGLATSFLIYAFSIVDKKIKMAIFMLLAISFHKSALLPIVAYFITLKFTNTKALIRIWIFMVIFSFLFGDSIESFIQDLIGYNDFTDTTRTKNLYANKLDGKVIERGYRLDFILYSGFAILLGYIYIIKKKVRDTFYIQLLNVYLISNTVWVILIYAAFTNRIAYLSWFLMPIVMIYPLLKYRIFTNQSRMIAYLIFGSLMFTLLLNIS